MLGQRFKHCVLVASSLSATFTIGNRRLAYSFVAHSIELSLCKRRSARACAVWCSHSSVASRWFSNNATSASNLYLGHAKSACVFLSTAFSVDIISVSRLDWQMDSMLILKDVLFNRRCWPNSLSKDLSGSRQWHALSTD